MTYQNIKEVSDNNPLPVEDHGSDSIASGRVNVGSDPTLIVPARPGRKSVLLCREDTYPIWIGNESLTDSNGFKVFPPGMTTARVDTSAAIYGLLPGTGDRQTIVIGYLELF